MAITWDFSCVDSMAPSRVRAMNTQACRDQEKRKIETYKNLSPCYLFSPVVIETLGQWGPLSFNFVKAIGRRMADQTGEPRSGYFLRQRLSIAVVRGNTQSILGTMQNCGDLELPFN